MADWASGAKRPANAGIGSHFDERASHYDAVTPWVHDVRSLEPIATYLKQEQPRSALELGVGTGAVPGYLRRAGALPEEYVGLDISAEMLRYAHGWTPVHGSAEDLPFDRATFDAVIARQAIHYFASLPAVLDEVVRVLRPSGALVVAQMVAFDNEFDLEWWSRAVSLRQPLRQSAVDPEELRRRLRDAAFRIDAATEVHGRSSLRNWLRRYPIGKADAQALLEHFRTAPEPVSIQRRFVVLPDGDIVFSVRWLVWLAHVTPAG